MKKTLISIAALLAMTSAFATNGTEPTGNTVTVGDNRNGQVAAQGSAIANGGANYGGTANGGVARTTSGPATTTGGTAYGGVGGTVGPQTVQQSANNSNAGIVGQGGAGGKGGAGGAASASAAGGAATSTSTSAGGAASISGTVGGAASTSVKVNVDTVDKNSLAIAEVNAAATVAAAEALADQKIRNTPNVSGAALVSSNDTCMGSASAGGSGPGFGLSFGTTYIDESCVRLKYAREAWNMGLRAAAVAMLCNQPEMRAALEVTGYPCPAGVKVEPKVAAPTTYEPTDPIVRRRMGLPPIKE